ncbi:MAG: 4Fe-4S binding protein [Coriobacteriia bacterium]|nr:4Fe-4S binding protein [Coriobacteriia bacterium]
MSGYGLLIDYEFCTGCHSCEVACKTEKNLPEGQFGIQLAQIGPWRIDETRWQYDYVPVPTDICDLCQDRVAAGKMPKCVHHCQSLIMEYGPVEELAVKAAGKSKTVLFSR